jgi:hypothetical protein
MIIFIINRSFAQPILRSSISPRYKFDRYAKTKNEIPSSQPQQTCTKKQKVKNIQTQKIDNLSNDHIFYLAATAHASFYHLQFFAVACKSKARSFAATQ